MYCIWRSRTVMWNYLGSVFFLGYFLLRSNCQNATDVSTSQTGNKHCRIAQASNSNSPPPRYNLFVTLLSLSSGVNQIFYRNIYHCVMVCDWYADLQDYFFSIVYTESIFTRCTLILTMPDAFIRSVPLHSQSVALCFDDSTVSSLWHNA